MKSLLLTLAVSLFPVVACAADEAPPKHAKSEVTNLLKPTNDVDSWLFELNGDGDGEIKVDGDAIVFNVTKTDDENWHVQAYQTEIPLKEGKDYVVKFKLKAPDASEILLLGLINEEDWHEIGLHETLGPSDDYEEYEFTFTATDVKDSNNRIGFVLGGSKGTVSVKELSLSEK
jgi:hypothetical protein